MTNPLSSIWQYDGESSFKNIAHLKIIFSVCNIILYSLWYLGLVWASCHYGSIITLDSYILFRVHFPWTTEDLVIVFYVGCVQMSLSIAKERGTTCLPALHCSMKLWGRFWFTARFLFSFLSFLADCGGVLFRVDIANILQEFNINVLQGHLQWFGIPCGSIVHFNVCT